MGKRINPNNLRAIYLKEWASYCPNINYSESFGKYIFLTKWCTYFFQYFIKLFYSIKNNQIYLTILVYFPYYHFLKKSNKRFFKRIKRKLKRKLKLKLTYTKKKQLKTNFLYFKHFYKIQEIFYFKRLLNKYKKFLELICFKTLKQRIKIRILNIADLYRNKKAHRKLYSIYLILNIKLISFYRRFNKNYKHIIKLFALSCYLKEPLLIILVIKRLFKTPRRHFLVLRLIKSYIDLIYLFNADIKGVRFQIKGKFNGRLRTRKMVYQRGRIPLQTINVDLKYAGESFTTKVGMFGVRVWYYCGSFTNRDFFRREGLVYKKLKIEEEIKIKENMVIKNFFYTWLNYKVREKRKKQKKIKLVKKKYGVNKRSKNAKIKVKNPFRKGR